MDARLIPEALSKQEYTDSTATDAIIFIHFTPYSYTKFTIVLILLDHLLIVSAAL